MILLLIRQSINNDPIANKTINNDPIANKIINNDPFFCTKHPVVF